MPATDEPSMRTLPALGESRPPAMRRSVDFPHPLVPRIARTSPGRTVSDTSRSTGCTMPRAPRFFSEAKARPTPANSTAKAELVIGAWLPGPASRLAAARVGVAVAFGMGPV